MVSVGPRVSEHGGRPPHWARLRRLASVVRKEFIEIRHDRRTVALIVGVPVILLIVFGYAANFEVQHISTEFVGHNSQVIRRVLSEHGAFDVQPSPALDVAAAEDDIQHGRVAVAIVLNGRGIPIQVVIDGSNLLVASTAERELTGFEAEAGPLSHLPVDVLYNPELNSTIFMIPGLIGIIMTQVALEMTALGVVREREQGTIEQLMITPITRLELMMGKTIPYLAIALFDLSAVLAVSRLLFDVHVDGSILLLIGEACLFLTATLGLGLLISTLAQTQLQATQMSLFVLLPQLLLSGLIFPLVAIPWGVRWISYVMPLTYFVAVTRGIMLKATGINDLWTPTIALSVLAVAYLGIAAMRFEKTMD